MNDITKSKVNEIWLAMQETFSYLWGRWQDEGKYENWNDYENHLRKVFDEKIISAQATNAVFIKANKRPFSVTFDFEGWQVVMSETSSQYKWSASRINKQ
jgi:hypothetical protein